jgi:hypothetical protein
MGMTVEVVEFGGQVLLTTCKSYVTDQCSLEAACRLDISLLEGPPGARICLQSGAFPA